MRRVPSSAAAVIGAALAFASCKSNDITAANTNTTISIGQQCIASGSDSGTSGGCAGGAVCSVTYCRTACTSDGNCDGGVCLSGSGGNGCRIELREGRCATTSDCTTGLVCAADHSCRNFCVAGTPCSVSGDVCTDGACYGPSGGMDGGAGQDATVLDATGPDGAVSQEGGSLDSGVTLNPCPAAQEQFGFTAQGDSNSNFTSGVGVRTATQLLVFNGYAGAPDSGVDASAADGGAVNLVFVQAFDPVTAQRLAPPAVLFQAPDGDGFTLLDVSIAPSGQIALAFGYGGFHGVGNVGSSNVTGSTLYAAFLAPLSTGGGTGSLQVGRTVQLESGQVCGQPHAIWSVASQAFVFSWEYMAATWGMKLTQLLADGRPSSGGGVVPTDQAGGPVYPYGLHFSGAAGTSGSLIGIGFLQGSNLAGLSYGYPYLTILDSMGNQVGSSIQLAATNSAWIAVAGTSTGFVSFYDNGTGVSEAFVGVSADGGVPASSADGGDAGALPGFVLPGAADALDVRAVGDDTSGPGGVGAALLYPTQVGFGYVNPDGRGPLAHFNPILPHTYVSGDFMAISNYKGLFAVSLYDSTKHSTQVIASGCQ